MHYKHKIAVKNIKKWTGLDDSEKAFGLFEMDITRSQACDSEPCELCGTYHQTRHYIQRKVGELDTHTVGSTCISKFPIDVLDDYGNIVTDPVEKERILKSKGTEIARIRKYARNLVSIGEDRDKWNEVYAGIARTYGKAFKDRVATFARIEWNKRNN